MRWVSALSWYFLNLFGLNAVFKLILGQDNGESPMAWLTPAAAETRDMGATAMMGGAGAGMTGPGAPEMAKQYQAEVENLSIADGLYRWSAHGVEDRVLAQWGQA